MMPEHLWRYYARNVSRGVQGWLRADATMSADGRGKWARQAQSTGGKSLANVKTRSLPASVERNGHQRPAHRGDQLASLITRVADFRTDRDRLEQIVGSRTQQ